jgi:hypothetical protein
MNFVTTDQPLKPEEQTLVEEIYKRLDLFEQANRPYHEAAKEARAIVRLRDPEQDPPGTPESEKTLQLQTLKSTFNNVVADQMQNLPEAKLVPERPEQQEIVDDLQDLIHYNVYEVNNYEKIHRRVAEDLYAAGTGIVQVAWDPDKCFGKGDIALIRWPVESFLWDAQADDIQNARAVIKVSWHPMSWYQAHYPDKCEYVHGEKGEHANVGLSEAQLALDDQDEDRAMMLEYWYRKYDAKARRYTINVAYCAGGALLEKHEDVYMHGEYPFILDTHTTIEGAMVGEGLVTEFAPMMRYINRYAKYIDTNLRMSSKGRILTRKNSNIDREALADWSQDIIEGDSVVQGEDWNWMQHVPFNGMISNQMLQFQSDMKQDSGANQFMRGETTGGIVSGKAIAALQSAGSKVQQLQTQTLNNGFKKMVQQILWLMAEFYDDQRVVMVTGRRDGMMRQVTVDLLKYFGMQRGKKNVSPPPFTVQVEVITKDPIRIQNMNEFYMQAYTMAAQAQQYFPLSALFRIMNIEGKDRLLPVIEQNEMQQQQMQQMAQQNEELQAQVQQLGQDNENLRNMQTRMAGALGAQRAEQTPEMGL